MIVTEKIGHTFDFSIQLAKARLVAKFAVENRYQTSSRLVKHIGLKSVLSCQILRKYGRNHRLKSVKRVNLIVPGQGIQFRGNIVKITSLGIQFPFVPRHDCIKINEIEAHKDCFYINYSVNEPVVEKTVGAIGVDLNSTGHAVVIANPVNGKVFKMGKSLPHIRRRTKNIRNNLHLKRQYRLAKKVTRRTTRRMRNIDHRISRFVVNYAKHNSMAIHLENLKNFHRRKKSATTNTWSFGRLQRYIEYKAKMCGVAVYYVDPAFTSQICSRSGLMGSRDGKIFRSPKYGVEDANVNAAFNIALRKPQLAKERDFVKGCTDQSTRTTL